MMRLVPAITEQVINAENRFKCLVTVLLDFFFLQTLSISTLIINETV